jgi:hypothetical protein
MATLLPKSRTQLNAVFAQQRPMRLNRLSVPIYKPRVRLERAVRLLDSSVMKDRCDDASVTSTKRLAHASRRILQFLLARLSSSASQE